MHGVYEMTDEEVLDMFEPASIVKFLWGPEAVVTYWAIKNASKEKVIVEGPTPEEVITDRVEELRRAYEVLEPLRKSPFDVATPRER